MVDEPRPVVWSPPGEQGAELQGPPPSAIRVDDPSATGQDWRAAEPTLPLAPPFFERPRYVTGTVPALPPLAGAEARTPHGARRGGAAGIAVVVGVLSAVLAATLTACLFLAFGRGSARSTGEAAAANTRLANRDSLDIQALLTKAQPSVVAIQTGQSTTAGVYGGAGTGLIISDDGLVLTNAHVAQGSSTMTVTLFDGTVHKADLVGSSPEDDIALVRVRGVAGLKAAELGSSADARVGDDVVAIGNALNLGGPPSVTEGIVSAKDRTIEAPTVTLHGLIQTDAAINPGNSGGPLLDARGQVIGINTAIISDAQNIGFAIPIDAVKPLIADLEAGKGAVTLDTAFLGVVTSPVEDITSDIRVAYGVTADRGAFVTDLVPESAATDGGLELGDVITSVDGRAVTQPSDVADIVRSHAPGDEIVITYEREGRERSVDVELRSRRDSGG